MQKTETMTGVLPDTGVKKKLEAEINGQRVPYDVAISVSYKAHSNLSDAAHWEFIGESDTIYVNDVKNTYPYMLSFYKRIEK